MKACAMRYGVHGSALPGFSTSGVFNAMAGTHSECTPGRVARQHHAERVASADRS